MKYYLIILILVFSCLNKTIQQDFFLKYVASTRGSSMELTISNGELNFKASKKNLEKTLSKKELKKIKKLLDKIELQAIHTLEPPSTKSHFDGAMSASITIQTNGKEYVSSRFDHGNPPEVLKPLTNYILDLIYIDSN